MQFVAGGPDVPTSLLEAHEEGRVVFFCGAGISYTAGLPGFKGLVDAMYKVLGTRLSAIEQAAYDLEQFDAVLDLLERRIPGQRLEIRSALAQVLQPTLDREGATDAHSALLRLGCSREGVVRLVTTNFDRIFLHLTTGATPVVPSHQAPMLPIPRNSRWNGVVHLHGLLPSDLDEHALNRLVLTSGDFGLAYLTERWAARFVGELLRNYVVCFVGYSINDPVLRYMMDALAADRMLGEVTLPSYALGACAPGQEKRRTIEWEAKGVVPILYAIPGGTDDHSALRRTLKAWAETYRDGILGAERIVVELAAAQPSTSTPQDDFAARMRWALSHESGLPAKLFADFNPVPPLQWLQVLSEECYGPQDLPRFGVPTHSSVDEGVKFSLLRRPTAHTHAPWMNVVAAGSTDTRWDVVMNHLARWLVRHLDDPELVLWVIQRGGQPSPRLLSLVDQRLEELATLERGNKAAELAAIQAQAPNAIPRPTMRLVWRLFLAGSVKSGSGSTLYRLSERLKREGPTAPLRFRLREALAPKVLLRRALRSRNSQPVAHGSESLRHLFEWELVLASDHVNSFLRHVASADHWRVALTELLNDLEQLVRDALDLLQELGEVKEGRDHSQAYLPSIARHWQNRRLHEWTALLEMLRDAWLEVRSVDPARATRVARGWFNSQYSAFKRMALFAASQEDAIAPAEWVAWLLADDARWLWAQESRRETLRLLVLQGPHLSSESQAALEGAVLNGPPGAAAETDRERWRDHAVWLRLAKLGSSGIALGPIAAEQLDALVKANPLWRLAEDQRDEFWTWMSGTGDPGFDEGREVDHAPRKRAELATWLKRPPPSAWPLYRDTWRETCRGHFYRGALALCDLATEGQWPAERWREALLAWSEEAHVVRSWRFLSPLVQRMPDQVLKEVEHSATSWLQAVSKRSGTVTGREDVFFALCRRVLTPPHLNEQMATEDLITRAVNHPIGHVTEALLNWWFEKRPNDGDRLPAHLEPLFTRLCDTTVEPFRHGRVLLASHLVAIFRVDRPWCEGQLLPLLDWNRNAVEARAAWIGFLWSPRLHPPLLRACKEQMLATAAHYEELGRQASQFASFFTHAALEHGDEFEAEELERAIGALPQDGLESSAEALVSALEGAGDKRDEYWVNRILPFWKGVWPKTREVASGSLAESLARLVAAAGVKFPEALDTIGGWLKPLGHPDFVVQMLVEEDLSTKFPAATLSLLARVIGDRSELPDDLDACLATIADTDVQLCKDSRFVRLAEYARQRRG